MNLKKAFQYQKALKGLTMEIVQIAGNTRLFVKLTEEHQKEALNMMNPSYSFVNEVKDFSELNAGKYDLAKLKEMYDTIVKWRTNLSKGISQAKSKVDIGEEHLDFDAALIFANDQRYIAQEYKRLSLLQIIQMPRDGSLNVATNMGSASVSYTIVKKETPLPDVVDVATAARTELNAKLDAVSDAIEAATLTVQVEQCYVPPIPISISFEDLYRDFDTYKNK